MALDRAEAKRIARLARIRVPEEELDGLARELSAILGWIDTLNRVDVGGVEPMASAAGATRPARADAVVDGGDAARVLANAPEAEDDHFVVPKVVE